MRFWYLAHMYKVMMLGYIVGLDAVIWSVPSSISQLVQALMALVRLG